MELSALVMKAALDRAGVDGAMVDDVAWGCAMPEASQGLNVARLSAPAPASPVEVPAQTINRFCSSGLQTIANGAMQIMSGMADVVLTGGIEMMSQVPMSGYHARSIPRRSSPTSAWASPPSAWPIAGRSAARIRTAGRWRASRRPRGRSSGAFDGQIVPVPVERCDGRGREAGGHGELRPRRARSPETTAEGLAKLKLAFKANGTVTAGNASPYSDGAAAVLLMRRDKPTRSACRWRGSSASASRASIPT